MSNDDGLPPELAALLDAERAAAGPSAAVKARVLSRLEHTLGLSDGGDGGEGRDGGSNGGGSAGSGSSASSASSSGLHLATPFGVGNAVFGGVAVAVTVLGLVAGVLVGVFGGERELSSRTAADVANTAERAPAPDRDPDRAPDRDHDADRGRDVDVASDDDGFVIDESELRVEADPVPSERPLRAPAPRSESSTLSEEQALLDAARGALAAGELSVAERTLRRHARAFSRGQLAEERSALLVLTLARAGRSDDAKNAAAAFRARWPQSLHQATVDAALAEAP